MSFHLEECYNLKTTSFDKETCAYFENLVGIIENATFYIHEEGIDEDITDYLDDDDIIDTIQQNKFKDLDKSPFTETTAKDLKNKLPRLDQLPLK